MKQSADDNFEFGVNSRKFSKLVENTVGKGEIARYEQFLLFPHCFQKACVPGASKGVIVWEWVKWEVIPISLNIFATVLIFTNAAGRKQSERFDYKISLSFLNPGLFYAA